ncbi:PEP-CTERM sorting domain-containing protein [Singulisphaera rosea]
MVGPAEATPYYNVTNLGSGYSSLSHLDGQYVVESESGVYYSFPKTTYLPNGWRPPEGATLPGGTYYTGWQEWMKTTLSMRPFETNTSGTLIGTLPSGQHYSDPFSAPIAGYVQLLSSGQYGEFHPLLLNDDAQRLDLSQTNQILVRNLYDGSAKLVDLNRGTVSDFRSLLPPALAAQFPETHQLEPYAISDNGTLLVGAWFGTWMNPSDKSPIVLLLSPPDQPLPSPVPEPSTLAVIAAGVVGVSFRRWLRRLA